MNDGPQETQVDNVIELDRLYHEINLLRIEGYLFCLDPREAAKRKNEQIFDREIITRTGKIITQTITIEPHPNYGWPSVIAYKILKAILKKYSDRSYPFPKGVPFTQRELAKAIGRQGGGKDLSQINNALKQLKNTNISCKFRDKKSDEWVDAEFSIVDSFFAAGKGNNIKHYYICLHSLLVESLNNRHMICLNYKRMEHLSPIACVLFEQLYYRFSNQFNGRNSKQVMVKKDYETMCKEWLGGLKVLTYKSHILKDQLGSHFQRLKESKLVKDITLKKNANGTGYNIESHPGKGFFEDYNEYYSNQLKLDFQRAEDDHEIIKPMEIVAYFYQKLHGVEKLDNETLLPKDIDYGKELLKKYTFDELKDWIDYSIKTAKKTRYDIQLFRGIKTYETGYLAEKRKLQEAREKKKQLVAQQKKEAENKKLMDEYNRYKNEEVQKYKESISEVTLKNMKQKIIQQYPFVDNSDSIISGFIDREIETKVNFPSFEEWKNAKIKCGLSPQ